MIASVAVGIGLAAAAGLRVFLPMLVLGGAARLGWISLGADFEWIASNVGLATLAMATAVEIAAYSVPTIDNAVDIIAGPAAVVAGVIATAAVTGDLPTPLRWSLAVIAGGGAAAAMQSMTTLARLKSTGFTGGLANPLLAGFELFGSAALALLSIAVPLLTIALVLGVGVLAWRRRRLLVPRR